MSGDFAAEMHWMGSRPPLGGAWAFRRGVVRRQLRAAIGLAGLARVRYEPAVRVARTRPGL